MSRRSNPPASSRSTWAQPYISNCREFGDLLLDFDPSIRRGDCRFDICVGRFGSGSDELLGGRVDDREGGAVRGIDELPVDQHLRRRERHGVTSSTGQREVGIEASA